MTHTYTDKDGCVWRETPASLTSPAERELLHDPADFDLPRRSDSIASQAGNAACAVVIDATALAELARELAESATPAKVEALRQAAEGVAAVLEQLHEAAA